MRHLSQSRKRQNCGSSAHEPLSADLGSRAQFGLGTMSHGGSLSSRSFQFNGFETGNNSFHRSPFNNGIAPDGTRNAMLTSPVQQSLSNSVGSPSSSSFTLVGEEGRNSHKRKSTMDLYPDSSTHAMSCGMGMGDNLFHRFTQNHGTLQSDTSLNSLCDEFRASRRPGHVAYHSVRTSVLPASLHDGINTSVTQDNYFIPSITQNERHLRRVLPRIDTINESVGNMGVGMPETLALRQGNVLSATGSRHRNGQYLEESASRLSFFETMRNFNAPIDGNGGQGEPIEMIGAASVDNRSLQPPRRGVRPPHFQQFTSEFPHISNHRTSSPYSCFGTMTRQLPSFASVQLSNRYSNMNAMAVLPVPELTPMMNALAHGPQPVFGDLPSGSMPGQLPPRYNEGSRTSLLRQVPGRGHRALQSDGLNHHQYSFSQNELTNQYAYEWGTTYDEHSDMRLDVDNMSYEELLALEERIGNVNTGIEEPKIENCLKLTTHSCSDAADTAADSQESDAKCSICQEEYVEGDERGELHCGHGYHADCIKQWLLVKNQCPICKAAAN